MNTQEIMHQIDIQLRTLMHIRAMFPTMGGNMIGQTNAMPPPFYQMHGFRIELRFERPLTDEQITLMNNVGRWVNQSFIIRLCAVLESYHIIPPTKKYGRINNQLDGHEAVDIIRRLRDLFAHTSGRYNPNKRKEKKLYKRIIETYSISAEDPSTASEFPVPIDTLLIPLAEGSKRYVIALSQGNSQTSSRPSYRHFLTLKVINKIISKFRKENRVTSRRRDRRKN